jgi:hypothetical protein
LPWSPAEARRARVFCDIYTPHGTPFDGIARRSQHMLEKTARGWTYNVGLTGSCSSHGEQTSPSGPARHRGLLRLLLGRQAVG